MAITEIEAHHVVLKGGRKGTIYYVPGDKASLVPSSTVTILRQHVNAVIAEGTSYPMLDEFATNEQFAEFWMAKFTAILVSGEEPLDSPISPDAEVLGNFYVKPNYVGRCSHVCNAGFVVNPKSRGLGLGRVLGEAYVKVGPRLGYEYSVFNLVFETNVASIKTWDSLGFDRIGRIPGAAKLKGHKEPVDAIMFGKSFRRPPEQLD